jgi:hypothetical protein
VRFHAAVVSTYDEYLSEISAREGGALRWNLKLALDELCDRSLPGGTEKIRARRARAKKNRADRQAKVKGEG